MEHGLALLPELGLGPQEVVGVVGVQRARELRPVGVVGRVGVRVLGLGLAWVTAATTAAVASAATAARSVGRLLGSLSGGREGLRRPGALAVHLVRVVADLRFLRAEK